MSDQQRRIRSEWSQAEAAGRDFERLAEVLDLGREDLEAQLEPLRLALEGGCVEYKRSQATAGFRALEDVRYRSLSSAAILVLARQFAALVYVATIQKLVANGTIVLREKPAQPGEEMEPEDVPDVKDIIAEVEERVRNEPDLRNRQPVKNILMQISRYSREVAELREATARTPQDKRPPIIENFKRTSDEIFSSIRRNYDQLQAEERASVPTTPQNILLRHDLKPLAGVFQAQAKEASAVRSILLYARDEQYGMRETILKAAGRHEHFEALLQKEYRYYMSLGGTETVANQIAWAFRNEIEKRISREIEYY